MLKAITSAKDHTGETARSFRYAFKNSLNSASKAVAWLASLLYVTFKITSMLAISI